MQSVLFDYFFKYVSSKIKLNYILPLFVSMNVQRNFKIIDIKLSIRQSDYYADSNSSRLYIFNYNKAYNNSFLFLFDTFMKRLLRCYSSFLLPSYKKFTGIAVLDFIQSMHDFPFHILKSISQQ